jgi:hypothetical protein
MGYQEVLKLAVTSMYSLDYIGSLLSHIHKISFWILKLRAKAGCALLLAITVM